jgi:hypothetical protein
METILVNLIIGFAVLLFGAMAIFPMLIEGKPARRTPFHADDDQVISIQPVATAPQGLRPVSPLGRGDTVDAPGPDHRHAA